jgi:Putative zinc-finger
MTCSDFQELMLDELDGLEPANRSSLELHLAGCPACRAWQAATSRLQHGLGLLTTPLPPPALSRRIAVRLIQDYRTRRRRRFLLTTAAAAVILAMAFSTRFLLFPPDSRIVARKGSELLVPSEIGSNPVGPSRDGIPTVRESLSEVGSAMASAAARTADATMAQSRIFLPLVPASPLTSLPSPPAMETPTQSLLEAGQGVSDGLAPVADSAKRAFDLFLRDLPPMNLDAKSGL